jgi:hypothetical protein
MSDWYDLVVPLRDPWNMRDLVNAERRPGTDKPKPGDVVFRRRKGRKDRNRYFVLRASGVGIFEITNAVIQYQKNRNCWAIFVFATDASQWIMTTLNGEHQDPVKRYRTLLGAKMALMPNPLDRVGAETDAICEATSDFEKSLSAGNSVPPI